MKWLLLTMSVAIVNPSGLTIEQTGPFANKEACDFAHHRVLDQTLNLKTDGKLRITWVCVPQGKG